MGVSGVGKSTIGHLLSNELKTPYFDGDDFHPEENILKMSNGTPLNDEDRFDWLVLLNKLALKQLEKNTCIIGCSALKQQYREILSNGIEQKVVWVHLSGTFEQIADRIQKRAGHFMDSGLLKSQFDILEPPKKAITVDISLTPKEIVKNILDNLPN